jgi:hypothetical protein
MYTSSLRDSSRISRKFLNTIQSHTYSNVLFLEECSFSESCGESEENTWNEGNELAVGVAGFGDASSTETRSLYMPKSVV